MFKISIWYGSNADHKNVQDAMTIEYIKRDKKFGCTLDNQPTEYIVNIFITNVVFQNIGYHVSSSKKKELKFDFEKNFPNRILCGPWYNTMIYSQLYG